MESQITKRQISERRIFKFQIIERRKLPNVEYCRKLNIVQNVEYYRT